MGQCAEPVKPAVKTDDLFPDKVLAFSISAAVAGTAGALFAHLQAFINPGSFDFMKSVDIVIMVVLGGMGSISGAVLAAIVLTLLPEALRNFSQYRMIVYAVSLIAIMIARPQGLFGTKEIWETAWFRWLVGRFRRTAPSTQPPKGDS